MTKKIESLTPEQEAKLAEYRDKWIRIGLSTEPANRPEAERAIRMAYEAAGKKHPKIVWCGSPASIKPAYETDREKAGECVKIAVLDSMMYSNEHSAPAASSGTAATS